MMHGPRNIKFGQHFLVHTGCFMTCGHYCRRLFPRSLWSKNSYKNVSDFRRLRSYGNFFNSHTRPRVNRALWNQLVGDVLNLVAYRLRCKHYFCHLTCPPSYRQSSFCISTLGRYLRNTGKVGWVGIRLAIVYPYHLHYSECRLPMFRTVRR